MRILLTDDSRAVHAFVTQLFNGTTVEIEHAYNGQEALEMLLIPSKSFDVVLLDWEMPVLDGPSALLQIKARGIRTPVIMATTKCDLTSITKALQNGASDYVIKPFTQDILFGRIATICGKAVA